MEVKVIYAKFEALAQAKRDRIIHAAVREFVDHGFEKASTNEIVKAARISKGSLYNYFGNKRQLFIYLMHYSVQVIEALYESFDLCERDIFKRLENIALQKLKVHQKHPQVFDFLAACLSEESPQVKGVIDEHVAHIYERGFRQIYQDIDYSKFREDIEVEKALEILNWTMFGFGEKGIQTLTTFENLAAFEDEYYAEWKIYAQILKNAFYKNG